MQDNDGNLSELEIGTEQPSVSEAELVDDAEARSVLLQVSIAAAGIGTFDWDLVNKNLKWDDRLVELFGYSSDGFDQTIEAFNRRLHPDDLPRVSADLQKAINGCGEFESEYRVVVPGGGTRWIGARGRALCDETGKPVRMLGAAWDATARGDEAARMARGIESMATAFFSLDTSWRFTYANAEAERVLGKSRQDMLGGVLWELFPAAIGSVFESNYRNTMETGDPSSFDAYYPAPLDAWFEVRAWRNPDGLAVYFLDVTERHRAQEMAERAAARASLLARITEELATTLNSDEAGERLADLMVPVLADWCVVTLTDDEEEAGTRIGLSATAARHVDPMKQQLVESYAASRLEALTNDAIVVRAMETQMTQFIRSDATTAVVQMLRPGPVRDQLIELAPEAVMVLPLAGREGPVGMLTLVNCSQSGQFTKEDVTTAHHVAARAGLVLDNARLYRQQRQLAEGLQRSLLTEPAQPDHVQVEVRYTPAARSAQVGGDWYDAFLQREGALLVVIGDVVGHNVRAAADMGQVRSIVRTLGAVDDASPAEVLKQTDAVLETLRAETTATAVVARLEQTESELHRGITRLRWSSAGHPAPLVINPDGTVLFLGSPTSDLLLGVDATAGRRESEVTLDREAIVLLYTDGLVGRRGQDLDEGLEKLQDCLRELDTTHLGDLCDEVLRRMLPPQPDDDVALVAVKLHPQNEPRPAEAGPNKIPPNVEPMPEVIEQAD